MTSEELPESLEHWPPEALAHLNERHLRILEVGMYDGMPAHELAIDATRGWWAIEYRRRNALGEFKQPRKVDFVDSRIGRAYVRLKTFALRIYLRKWGGAHGTA